MIDEKKLLEALYSWDREWLYSLIRFENLVKEQPKIGEWIPSIERLPEERGNYLVQFDDGFIATVERGDEWFLWADSGDVVAWMPLPEPYHDVEEKRKIAQEDNPALNFEDLHEGMWVWDKKLDEYIKIDTIFDKSCFCAWRIAYGYDTEYQFEENRFYRKQVKE